MLNHFPSGHFQEPHPWFHKSGDTFESIKEAMFEKPLTPSDVGKLNRLVIPKQHAERYFPLSAGDAAGTLLGFEDESGKSWRFRYSYWNSSQSYVLTKGWSRYVKDKRLDAGDVVFFERHRDDRHKLFIGWRRRGSAAPSSPVCYNAQAYQTHNYQPDFLPRHPRGGPVVEEEEATRVQSGSNNIMNEDNYNNNPRRLVRLFGVNFECEEEESSVGRTTSSQGSTSSNSNSIIHNNQAYRDYFNYMGLGAYPAEAAPSTFQMDMEFGERQMGNRMG